MFSFSREGGRRKGRGEERKKKTRGKSRKKKLTALSSLPQQNATQQIQTGVSDEAKAFVRSLLDRDPSKRPSAAEALKHPWLAGGNSTERQAGRQLSLAVVQRVQRYASASAFRRSVLEMIAAELLADAAEAKAVQDRDEEGRGGRRGARGGGLPRHGRLCRLRPSPPPPESCPLDARADPLVTGPSDCAMEFLYDALGFSEGRDAVPRDEVLSGLESLGTAWATGSWTASCSSWATRSRVTRAQLAASQIDWGALRANAGEDGLSRSRAAPSTRSTATATAPSRARTSARACARRSPPRRGPRPRTSTPRSRAPWPRRPSGTTPSATGSRLRSS